MKNPLIIWLAPIPQKARKLIISLFAVDLFFIGTYVTLRGLKYAGVLTGSEALENFNI